MNEVPISSQVTLRNTTHVENQQKQLEREQQKNEFLFHLDGFTLPAAFAFGVVAVPQNQEE